MLSEEEYLGYMQDIQNYMEGNIDFINNRDIIVNIRGHTGNRQDRNRVDDTDQVPSVVG